MFLNNKQHELFDQGGASAGGQVADGDNGQRNGHHHDRREYRFIFTRNSGALKASSGAEEDHLNAGANDAAMARSMLLLRAKRVVQTSRTH
jgi:hypothetical protein